MGKQNAPYVACNGGEIGKEILARTSLDTYPHTASILENWLAESAGPMAMRPGLSYQDAISGFPFAVYRRFQFSLEESYLCIFTDLQMHVAFGGSLLARPSVTSSVLNPTFSSSSNWTDVSTGGSAAVNFGTSGLVMTSDGPHRAGAQQHVTTSSPGVLHALNIVVTRGPVLLKVGSTSGGFDYVAETTLNTGQHSLAFTPAGSFYVEFGSFDIPQRIVASCQIAPAGQMAITTPFSLSELRSLRFDQSANVMFVTSGSDFMYQIERRGPNSWSVAESLIKDGPFLPVNIDQNSTITPSALVGDVTLTASKPLFTTSHLGALFQLVHAGQKADATLAGDAQYTDPVLVSGVGSARTVFYTFTSHSLVGTVKLQRSVGDTLNFVDVQTVSATGSYNDGYDNATIYYRLGINATFYTSGSVDLEISFPAGSTTGIARITAYTDSTHVSAQVFKQFGATVATSNWSEGAWSPAQDLPSGVALWDGRLWVGGTDIEWGSQSDIFTSFDAGTGLASNSVTRSVSSGSLDPIFWLLALEYLMAGTATGPSRTRSSALDEPVTPTNIAVRQRVTVGAANVAPAKIDTSGIFVDKSGWRAYELAYVPQTADYGASSLMRLNKMIGSPGILQIAVARQPEPRLYMIRADGQCLVLLYDPSDQIVGWGRLITDGAFESVEVLPGQGEDQVYFSIARTIGMATRRYIEKLDTLYLASANAANPVDSFVRYDGAPITVMTGLDHLEGKTVEIWGDGRYHCSAVVTGGQVSLVRAASHVVAGLYYKARYQSSKLAFGSQAGTALGQRKRVTHITPLLLDYLPGALSYGTDFNKLDRLNDRYLAQKVIEAAGNGLFDGEADSFPVPGGFDRDPRLCLQADSRGGPVRVQGFVLTVDEKDRVA